MENVKCNGRFEFRKIVDELVVLVYEKLFFLVCCSIKWDIISDEVLIGF